MNIVLGKNRDLVPDGFTVLELDTFQIAGFPAPQTAYCVIENVPLQDFPVLDAYIKVHHDMMQAYKDKNWEYCRSAINGLMGKWNSELDTFYTDLAERVAKLEICPPGDDWDGSVIRSNSQPFES